MGDNKISDEVIRDLFLRNGFTIKEGQDDLKPYVYAAARELIAHLQGEAVPVAWLIYWSSSELQAPELTRNAGRVTEIMALDNPPRVEPLYLHPQPAELSERAVYQCPRCGTGMEVDPTAKPSAELNEVSGDSGELGGAIERLGRYAYIAEQSGEQQACRDIRKVLAALAATGKQQVGEVHPDDAAVDAFAVSMKAKMAAARAKGRCGWEDPAQCSADDLTRMLRDHVEKGDPRDVANFCMMLHQRGEAIASRQPGAVE